MKIIIFYFSGTGNTWWVAKELKQLLEEEENKCQVEMYSVESHFCNEINVLQKKVLEADYLIIGYPVYASDLPLNIKAFFQKLPASREKKLMCASFCTQASFSGDGAYLVKKLATDKGYEFRQSFQINMTTNFNVGMIPFYFSKPAKGEKLANILKKAKEKLEKMALKIIKKERYYEGRNVFYKLLAICQRSFFQKKYQKLILSFKFRFDKCIKCNLCLDVCPAKCLLFSEEGKELKRNNSCLLCFRCYNFCPGKAIEYGKIVLSEKCIRYSGPIEKLNIEEIRK